MESKLKQQCQDSAGELYENMLLKEGGFPHLPNPVFVPEPKTKQAIVGLLENKSDAWNDAGTNPSKIGVYQTRLPHDENGIYYQVWRGNYWVYPHGTKEGALSAFGISNVQDIQWREVQP